jgi:hypothetical protein
MLPDEPDTYAAFAVLAERHRMIPLVAQVASATALQKRSFGLAAHGSSLIAELVKIHGLFSAAEIRWVTYKGPVLSMDLYGDPLLRPCDDIDLLIHPDDLQAAIDLLVNAGYHAEQSLSPGAMKERLRGNWGLDFRSPESNHLIEVKTDIAPRFYALSLADRIPWETPRQVELDGLLYPILPRELQTIALAAHGGWHLWERLLWVLDLAMCLKRDRLQLAATLELAKQTGATRLLGCGYQLTRELLDGPDIHALNAEAEKMALQCAALHPDMYAAQTKSHSLKTLVFFHLNSRERVRDQLTYLHRLLSYSSEGDWAVVSLPSGLSSLYRVLRPFRLIIKGVIRSTKKSG